MLYSWDSSKDYKQEVLFKNPTALTSVTFASDGRRIVIGDRAGLVRIIVAGSNLPPRILTGQSSTIDQVLFNRDNTFLATSSRDGSVRLWNWTMLSEDPIVFQNKLSDVSLKIQFSPDDQQIIILAANEKQKGNGIIAIWPISSSVMADLLCKYINRNMTKDEWTNFVGADLPYERTCNTVPENNK